VPDVLHLKSKDWELNVWVKDTTDRLRVLEKTLKARKRGLPTSALYLSPPLRVQDVTPATTTPIDAPVAQLNLPEPLFFENKQYEFEFTFGADISLTQTPTAVHRLAAIEDSFHFNKKARSLRGSINFGNDVGWFRLGLRYTLAGKEQFQSLSFEVLPTKMAMDTDLAAIHCVIDKAYPLWRFSFAQRTELELARSHKPHDRFALLWLAHFKKLRKNLEDGVKLVLSAPHARLLHEQRVVRLERLRGCLTPKLELRVGEHLKHGEWHHRYQVNSRRLSVDTPENRFVKMVVKRCSGELGHVIKLALSFQNAPEEGGRLSQSFFDELRSWKQPLDQLLNQPFFAEVGEFEGMERESLVLHQRAGYANIYRIWQELKMYLGIFGNNAAVYMKSVADLYEVWCFLEMKSMLEEQGFAEQSSSKASLRNVGFEKAMVNGTTSAFNLYRAADKLSIRLSHEPSFEPQVDPQIGKIYSWTTKQRPDIFLEATFDDGETLRWIFDAKYRVVDNDATNAVDMAPDDAINQMHRYRDALIHIDKAGEGWKEKSRPVMGAFVLYPGWFDEQTSNNPYETSIQDVGIGAFPMLPERSNTWLRQFLEKQFGKPVENAGKSDFWSTPYPIVESDKYFVEDSARISMTGAFLSRYRDLALVAHLGPAKGRNGKDNRDKDYLQRFADGKAGWYHIPVETTESLKFSISRNVMNETRQCAIAVPVKGERHKVLAFIYDVISVTKVKRCDLSAEQAGYLSEKTKEYWLLKLGASRTIAQPIVVKNIRKFAVFHTSATDITASKQWSELRQLYASLVQKDG
jgi:uncharacterized protein